MANLFPLVDCFRPGSDGNPIGNLGFSHFSPFALNAPFPVGVTELGDELLPIGGVPMVNKLVDRLVADRLALFLQAAGDDLRRPVEPQLLPDVLLYLLVLQ